MQTYFNTIMEKTDKLDAPESQKIAIFKRGLPKFIKTYIKQEKPEGLLENLKKAKEAEELGSNWDEKEDMNILKGSVSHLLAKLEPQSKPTVGAVSDQKCFGCGSSHYFMAQCPSMTQQIKHLTQGQIIKDGQTIPVTQQIKEICSYCGIPGHTMVVCRN